MVVVDAIVISLRSYLNEVGLMHLALFPDAIFWTKIAVKKTRQEILVFGAPPKLPFGLRTRAY